MKNKTTKSQLAAALNKHDVIGWVAVKERLPELEQDVLLFDDWRTSEGEQRKDIRVGHLSEFTTRKTSEGLTYYCEWRGTEFAFNITHWMALPEPPCR